MTVIKTTEDGWECVPELTEVLKRIDLTKDALYEIRCCVRSRNLDSMVDELKTHLIDALESLDEIDSTQEFITVDDEEDEDAPADTRMPDWFKEEVLPGIKADPFYKSDSYLD